MFDRIYEKDVAISGIGQSEVGRPSGKSAMRLTLDACLEAITDAGLSRDDIDGVSCWPGDNNNGDAFSPVGPNALIGTLGLKVNWYGGGYEGPGPLAGVINGAMAIAAGLCRHLILLDRGRVLAAGPTAAMLDPSLVRTLYGVDVDITRNARTGLLTVIPVARTEDALPS